MSITLRVLSPDKSVFDGEVDEIIIPSTTGQVGILPGHISMVTAVEIGVLRVLNKGAWESIFLMGGFAEVESNEVTVLVNSAEKGIEIDQSIAENELLDAQNEFEKINENSDKAAQLKAKDTLARAKARVQATKTS
tara:strand:- start:93 stop:500 length:408 start_codon:yes stop_codon:yes gene_type:complete